MLEHIGIISRRAEVGVTVVVAGEFEIDLALIAPPRTIRALTQLNCYLS
jgi:hypothetical protein